MLPSRFKLTTLSEKRDASASEGFKSLSTDIRDQLGKIWDKWRSKPKWEKRGQKDWYASPDAKKALGLSQNDKIPGYIKRLKRKDLDKSFSEEISDFDNILIEGRLQDVKRNYGPRLGDHIIDRLSKEDPSGKNKYLQWAAKMLSQGESYVNVVASMKQFHANANRLEKRDINQYKSTREITQATANLGVSRGEKRKIARSEADIVFENDKFLVIHPKTTTASQKYGKGTRWCTAATSGDNYFCSYSGFGNVFLYYVINKDGSIAKDWQKIALALHPDAKGKGEYFSSSDKAMTIDQVKMALGHNSSAIFKAAYRHMQTKGKTYAKKNINKLSDPKTKRDFMSIADLKGIELDQQDDVTAWTKNAATSGKAPKDFYIKVARRLFDGDYGNLYYRDRGEWNFSDRDTKDIFSAVKANLDKGDLKKLSDQIDHEKAEDGEPEERSYILFIATHPNTDPKLRSDIVQDVDGMMQYEIGNSGQVDERLIKLATKIKNGRLEYWKLLQGLTRNKNVGPDHANELIAAIIKDTKTDKSYRGSWIVDFAIKGGLSKEHLINIGTKFPGAVDVIAQLMRYPQINKMITDDVLEKWKSSKIEFVPQLAVGLIKARGIGESIQERYADEYVSDARPIDRTRAQGYAPKFDSFDGENTITFKTTGTDTYIQRVEMVNLDTDIGMFDDLGDRVEDALHDELRVECSCPAFNYWGFRHILTYESEVLGEKEYRSPDERNPELEGSVCKHLVAVLEKIVKDPQDIINAVRSRE